jgi:hypothetical protein
METMMKIPNVLVMPMATTITWCQAVDIVGDE